MDDVIGVAGHERDIGCAPHDSIHGLTVLLQTFDLAEVAFSPLENLDQRVDEALGLDLEFLEDIAILLFHEITIRQEHPARQKETSMSHVPVRVSTLRGDQKVDFDAYIKINEKMVLYIRKGDSFRESAEMS